MIHKIPLVLALCVGIKDVSSASFSKVFVQSGPDYPLEYVQYGAPSASYSPQIAQLTAAPVGSVVPYSSNYVPCVTPCVYPSQVASVAPSANIVQYKAPSLPVVVASRSEPSNYEYSYVVYDETTGDHKALRESSDGSVVRGGYTFLQPDGYVREVIYVADDTEGFKAVVKHYEPPAMETKTEHGDKSSHANLTHENQDSDESEKAHEEHVHENHHEEPSHENLKAHGHHKTHEEHDETHEEPIESHEENHETNEKPHAVHGGAHEPEEPNEHHHTGHAEPHEPQENYEVHAEAMNEHAPPADSSASEESNESHVEPKSHNHHTAVVEHGIENSDILISYSDIIKCVQAAISKANDVNTAPAHKPESPLTYIILNKPC